MWIPKYRKAILGGQVGLRLRELVVEVCKTNDVEILQGHISKDHVHLFVSEFRGVGIPGTPYSIQD